VVSAIRITFDSTKFGLKDLIIFLPGRLWGSSLSGGHVFAVAATDPRIAAVIAQAAMLSLMNANAPRRMAWRVMMPPKCSITGSAREVPQAMDASGALGLTGLVRIPRAGGVHALPWSTLGGPVMGRAQELMRRITDAALAGDVKTLADCYAEDAVAETPDWGKLEGRSEIVKYLQAFSEAFPDASFELVSEMQDGNVAIDEGYFAGTQHAAQDRGVGHRQRART
jgi:ketosteroid isomerase-like protein